MTAFLLPIFVANGRVFATIDPSYYTLSSTLQNQNQAINYTPITWNEDQYVSTMRTFVVNTNSPSGYKVFIDVPASESSAGVLLLSGGTASSPSIAPTSTTPSTASALSTNTWGFGIPSGTTGLPTNSWSSAYTSGTPSASSTYAGVVIHPNNTLLRSTTGTATNDSFDVYYGLRLGTDVLTHPGTYQTHVEYHVISQASNVVGGEATITPTSGPKAGGTTVTITTSLMADFVPADLSVMIGDGACVSPSGSISSGVLVITCTTPRHHPGLNNVVVSIDSLGLTYTINNGFEFVETGDVRITGVQYVNGINVSGTPSPSVDNSGNIDFDLTFLGGQDNTTTLEATYQITVTNSTDDDYSFTPPASNLTIRISQNEVRDITYTLSGISAGDTIPANSSVSFNIILSADYVSGEHDTEGGIEIDPVSQATPYLIGSIYGSNTGDLSGNHTLTSFQVEVESTFDESKTFTINSLNSDFEIVDSSGNALGAQTIAASTTGTYTFYMKKASGAAFASETTTAGITIAYDGTYTNAGEVNITVDRDPDYVDSQAPVISGVTITINNAVDGEATLTWGGTDNVGIASYGIYKCTTTCDNMISVNGLTNTYTFTGLSDATYHFIVVGFDDEGNTATQNQINGANTDPGAASSTGNVSLSWAYSVTGSIQNGSLTNTGNTAARAGGTWEGTITPGDSDHTIPSSKNNVTVKINGITTTNFQYDTNSGKVTINSGINGPIEVTATCPSNGCLIEGTMIAVLDENGRRSTKPIEDITYSDWLVVWNHETGTIGYVHPARIEKTRTLPSYQLTTFSDGTTLGTTSWHGIFDVDANEFVSVDDFEHFGVGTRVYKVVDDQLTPVTVTSIERVEEAVNVYYVTSSTYYNIISDDLITTNGYVLTSNFYGFDENLKWPAVRAEFISNPANLYTYEDFADIGIPLRMFNDLRLGEASYLQNYGITLQMFKDYLVSNKVIEDMVPYDDE